MPRARQLRGPALERHGALAQAVHALGQRQDLAHVLVHHERRGALAGDRAQDAVEALDHEGREPERDLVHQQEARVGHEPAADGQHLLLAPREVRARLAAALGQHREQLVDSREGPAARPAAVGADQQVLLDAQAGEDPAPLGHQHDAAVHQLVRGRPADRRAVEVDGGGGHRQGTRDRAEHRGLAGAVGADDRDRLAFPGFERDVEEGLEASVEGAQAADAQQGHCTSIPR